MNINSTVCKALLALVLLAILIAGLNPKAFRFSERMVHEPGVGLSGSNFTLAATGKFLQTEHIDELNEDGFGIRLSLVLPQTPQNRFMVIASVTTGAEGTQFLIGQWQQTLILMSGNDYPNIRNEPRLNIDTVELLSPSDPGALDLEIHFLPSGTTVLHQNQVVANNADYQPRLPGDKSGSFITVANTSNRVHGWPGTIRSLTVFRMESDADDDNLVSYDMLQQPIAVTSAAGLTTPDASLQRLSNFNLRSLQFLGTSLDYFGNGTRTLFDVVLNILGFIPLGILACLLLYNRFKQKLQQDLQPRLEPKLQSNDESQLQPELPQKTSWPKALLISVCIGFALSLFLELVQGFLPSRNSSVYDIIFNTAGTFTGALATLLVIWLFRKKPVVPDVVEQPASTS